MDKRYVFRAWALTTYLDLMNATDRRNQELVNWTADFGQEVPVYGLPIVPAFGLRGVVMAALLFLWSLLGCGVGESHPSQVTDTRVVAVVATPPVPAPGDRVALEIYAADPKARGLELLVWSCTPLGGEPCVESALGANERVFVSTDHAEGRFALDAPIPAQLAELAAQNGIEAVEARLWFLACAPERCPIIDKARRALGRRSREIPAQPSASPPTSPSPRSGSGSCRWRA